MLPTPEPLSQVLRRLGSTAFADKTPAANSKPAPVSVKTRAELNKYAKAQKNTPSKADEQLFKKVVGKAWSYRAADSCYTKLAEVKKRHGWNWKEDTLVLSAGQSIDFMQ